MPFIVSPMVVELEARGTSLRSPAQCWKIGYTSLQSWVKFHATTRTLTQRTWQTGNWTILLPKICHRNMHPSICSTILFTNVSWWRRISFPFLECPMILFLCLNIPKHSDVFHWAIANAPLLRAPQKQPTPVSILTVGVTIRFDHSRSTWRRIAINGSREDLQCASHRMDRWCFFGPYKGRWGLE